MNEISESEARVSASPCIDVNRERWRAPHRHGGVSDYLWHRAYTCPPACRCSGGRVMPCSPPSPSPQASAGALPPSISPSLFLSRRARGPHTFFFQGLAYHQHVRWERRPTGSLTGSSQVMRSSILFRFLSPKCSKLMWSGTLAATYARGPEKIAWMMARQSLLT